MADGLAALSSNDSIMIGIHTGGVWIARQLHTLLGLATPLGSININFYRDDFSRIGLHPQVSASEIPVDIEDQNLILVDDVLQTGRTVRAALNEIFSYGRPDTVRLAVMVERDGAVELGQRHAQPRRHRAQYVVAEVAVAVVEGVQEGQERRRFVLPARNELGV